MRKILKPVVPLAAACAGVFLLFHSKVESKETEFQLMETTIDDIHAAFKSGKLTSRRLAEMYLARIEAYDKKGPALNSIIAINPTALREADALDAQFKKSGPVGPLHGIPILLKDQADVKGMATTLGSLVLKDHMASKDAFVIAKLKKAGAIILAKTTLAEFAGGDTFGSLFGETKNPYDLLRTPGGSSGGSGAALAANFGAVALGQEGYSSIRRPSSWNALVGMRPTAGLVSRGGVYSGWPAKNGSLGPMTRTVKDMAVLLDSMVGYDPGDPVTAMGVGQAPRGSYTQFLKKDGLKGARLGILREPNGNLTEPDSEDFKDVTKAFDKAVAELKQAGAEVVDPIVIPRLKELLAKRASGPGEGAAGMKEFLSHSPDAKLKDMSDILNSPDYDKVFPARKQMLSGGRGGTETAHYEYLKAREELMINLMTVMADHKLDAIVHKSVEHSPTLITEGLKPPYPGMKGALHINTFLIYVSSVTAPAGFTDKKLPVGITFLGRPYSEPTVLKLAYAYEQATHHRKPPASTPPLAR